MTTLRVATSADLASIAALHAASWRNAYRGMLPDSFLDDGVIADRLSFWTTRFDSPSSERRFVLTALAGDELVGFVCVMLDAEPAWGARLDNLHVNPDLKRRGIGHVLFNAAREWIAGNAPGESMHLWAIEANVAARKFYDREGGNVAERTMREVARGLIVPALRYVWLPLRER